jgi:hypothetical protein
MSTARVICILAATATLAAASTINPVYSNTTSDATTGDRSFMGTDGKRYWTVAAGADSYQNDTYERPTVKTYEVRNSSIGAHFATDQYYANLDIMTARFGYDNTYLYVSIQMYGNYYGTSDGVNTAEGLAYQYGFRIGSGANVASAGGYLFLVDNPASKSGPSTFSGEKTFGYRDTNGDVGGTGINVTKQNQSSQVNGNGYETSLISDGRLSNNTTVLFSRVTGNTVEFALNYVALGLTPANLTYVEFEANKGLTSPSNYLWNDEYNQSEAGSPYRATSGDTSKSEFGTQGLENIYELDTVRMSANSVAPVPEPGTFAILGVGLAALGVARRKAAGQ